MLTVVDADSTVTMLIAKRIRQLARKRKAEPTELDAGDEQEEAATYASKDESTIPVIKEESPSTSRCATASPQPETIETCSKGPQSDSKEHVDGGSEASGQSSSILSSANSTSISDHGSCVKSTASNAFFPYGGGVLNSAKSAGSSFEHDSSSISQRSGDNDLHQHHFAMATQEQPCNAWPQLANVAAPVSVTETRKKRRLPTYPSYGSAASISATTWPSSFSPWTGSTSYGDSDGPASTPLSLAPFENQRPSSVANVSDEYLLGRNWYQTPYDVAQATTQGLGATSFATANALNTSLDYFSAVGNVSKPHLPSQGQLWDNKWLLY